MKERKDHVWNKSDCGHDSFINVRHDYEQFTHMQPAWKTTKRGRVKSIGHSDSHELRFRENEKNKAPRQASHVLDMRY